MERIWVGEEKYWGCLRAEQGSWWSLYQIVRFPNCHECLPVASGEPDGIYGVDEKGSKLICILFCFEDITTFPTNKKKRVFVALVMSVRMDRSLWCLWGWTKSVISGRMDKSLWCLWGWTKVCEACEDGQLWCLWGWTGQLFFSIVASQQKPGCGGSGFRS